MWIVVNIDRCWNGTINSIWAPGARKYGVVYDNVRVIYDGEGGYWLGANRATEKENEPNLVHVNANGVRVGDAI